MLTEDNIAKLYDAKIPLCKKAKFWVRAKFAFLQACSDDGSALLPFTSFTLSRQQVDDEPTCPPKYIYYKVSSITKEDVMPSYSLQTRRTPVRP